MTEVITLFAHFMGDIAPSRSVSDWPRQCPSSLGVAGVKNFKLGQSPCLFELCHWAFLVNALKSIDDSTETIIIRHRVAQLRSKAMSAIGTKRTCESIRRMSAFGGKADMAVTSQDVRL
jgi:hypothetical protein